MRPGLVGRLAFAGGGAGAVAAAARLFLQYFAGTSLVQEGPGGIEGFLVGFLSQDHGDEAYVHFVGVHPALRGRGVARGLYARFFAHARAAGRRRVRAITSPANTKSVAFHRAMGFEVEPGDRHPSGVPVQPDYDGRGQDRVGFCIDLGQAPG